MDNFQFKRSDRVNHEIKDIISKVVTSVVNIEGAGLITITEVKTSQNLRFSKIYISFMNNELNNEEIVLSMNRNIKEYRYHLGKELQLKYVPQILKSEFLMKYSIQLRPINPVAPRINNFYYIRSI